MNWNHCPSLRNYSDGASISPMSVLVGNPSDTVPAILAAGRADISTIYVSMSARHLDGRDADYLQWHSLDHRPEQYRLGALRAALRLVSTPECRAARAISHERYDATDHLMSYFFSDVAGLQGFGDLSSALSQAGRTPYLLPLVQRAVYRRSGVIAAPRIIAGADVLPWWPAKGMYVLIEQGAQPAPELIDVQGVGGVWWASALPMGPPFTTSPNDGLQIIYAFLDDDPVQTARRLRPVLEKRWAQSAIEPLLAAPFHFVVPYEWDRYLP